MAILERFAKINKILQVNLDILSREYDKSVIYFTLKVFIFVELFMVAYFLSSILDFNNDLIGYLVSLAMLSGVHLCLYIFFNLNMFFGFKKIFALNNEETKKNFYKYLGYILLLFFIKIGINSFNEQKIK